MNDILNSEKVCAIFIDCLSRNDDGIEVERITNTIKFDHDRLNGYRPEIEAMLDELPDTFQESVGGGWSFLNACFDKNGDRWTGVHQRAEQLFQLGMGIGKVRCMIPRELWDMLPGGMPYYIIV